ncbi:MAG: PAQR family membrane homeostasis protein TrhA [Gemmatimonadota bacterium]
MKTSSGERRTGALEASVRRPLSALLAPPPDEWANALTHGLGTLAALAGGIVLVVLAAVTGDPWKVVGAAVFSVTLVLLYTASTLYHVARSPLLKRRLKVLDHAAIYLLIAGSYTPFTLVGLRGPWGWSLFGVVWGLAVGGIGFKLFWAGRFRLVSTAIYVGMGWLILVAIGPMVRHLEPAVLVWLFAGGMAYTGGTFFYHNQRLAHSHAVWHGFVMAGSFCHAVAIGLHL